MFLNGESVSPLFVGEAYDLSTWPVIMYVPKGLPDGSTLLSVMGGDYVYYTNRCYASQGPYKPIQYVGAAGQTGKLVLQNFEDVGSSVIMVCIHNAARYPFTDRQECGARAMVKPIITKVTPGSGPAGTPIVIEGWGFGNAADYLSIGGASLTATTYSNTRIETTVPLSLSPPGPTTVYVGVSALAPTYTLPEWTATRPWTLTGP
jgi:hypothetical protein